MNLKRKIPVFFYDKYSQYFGDLEMRKKVQRLKRILSRSEVIGDQFKNFTTKEWIYSTKNTIDLMKKLSSEE